MPSNPSKPSNFTSGFAAAKHTKECKYPHCNKTKETRATGREWDDKRVDGIQILAYFFGKSKRKQSFIASETCTANAKNKQ